MTFAPRLAAVRRTDVMLRAEYPQLQTRIFEIGTSTYRIVFDKAVLNANTIRSTFHKKIRPLTLQVDVSNDLPPQFIREIPPIIDHEISKGFAGLSLTESDVHTILASKYPDLPELLSIGPAQPPGQELTFARQLTPEEESTVRVFFNEWEPNWPIRFALAAIQGQKRDDAVKIPGDMLRIRPAAGRPKAPRFVQEDEAFWFDHIDAIFEGGISPAHILGPQGGGMACYLDATSFPQIDLRQAVLCYDIVYISPPLTNGTVASFWENQAVTRDDVLELLAANRLKLVLTQPEERTDPNFLSAAYATNPSGIIGRRRAAAILAADLIQTADEYRLNQNDVVSHLSELARLLAPALQAPELEVIQFLTWPNAARRACLLPLMNVGLMSIGAFGPGRLLGEQLQRLANRDLQFETLVTSYGVHIAHTLNATLIPPTKEMEGWIWPRRIVGDRLNFYRSFNTRIAAAWAASERQREEQIRVLPPIPLFDFDRHAKIADVVRLSSYESDRRKARGLVTRLSELPIDERQAEIDRLSLELYEYGVRKEQRALAFDTFDDIKEVGAALADASLLPLRSAWNLVKVLIALGRKIPALDRFIDDLEHDLRPFRNDDIHFLSKIERVAELRLPKSDSTAHNSP